MHAVALGALRVAPRPCAKSVCRIVNGSRRQLARRSFHRPSALFHTPNERGPGEPKRDGQNPEIPGFEPGKDDATAEAALDSPGKEHGDGVVEDPAREVPEREAEREKNEEEETAEVAADEEATVPSPSRKGRTVSMRARLRRERQTEGLPPVVLPDSFWAKNVKLIGEADLAGSLAVFGSGAAEVEDEKDMMELARRNDLVKKFDLPLMRDAKYSMDVDVYQEIFTTLKAGLSLRPPINGKDVLRPHTVLQCPKDGGTSYLDSIVETIANKLQADLIRLDSQDIAQIIGPYLDENLAWTASTISLLGYEAQKAAGNLETYDQEPSGEEDEDSDNFSSLASLFTSKLNRDTTPKSRIFRYGPPPPPPPPTPPPNISIFAPTSLGADGVDKPKLRIGLGNPGSQQSSPQPNDHWSILKVSAVLEAIVGAADSKRASCPSVNGQELAKNMSQTSNLIVQLKDYKELMATEEGPFILQSLQSAINKRWKEGRNILLVGSTSIEDCGISKAEIQHIQSDIIEGLKKTIIVPPDRREQQVSAFESDEKARIRNINIRHIEDMIVKLTDGTGDSPVVVDIQKDLDTAKSFSAGVGEAVFTFPRVHRLATTIVGLLTPSNAVDGPLFTEAIVLISASDEAKVKWGAAELQQETENAAAMAQEADDKFNSSSKDKLKMLQKTCNSYEKKLLPGVIIPSDINTSFSDVHVAKETVEALRTLTSLALTRPEAFSYGILANDKIPGCLLYGPPGTGKTMLAKAVARESKATVLEVSGAEINNMFVGEGEKNVKAIFSLAKKLSPCVVFLDEADAILASRNMERHKASHREIINQFLKEWDGMSDHSTFIMVATNRPYDLDDAVFRRLPRRLLVDLPLQKDRSAILKLHLRGEQLDESVSLAEIAKITPFYSGSDLKNVAVAAALACVREENEIGAKHSGDEPYVYPEKRTLTKKHFDTALNEISASISEDMSSLNAIRKFDEKYGDRKGRKKKSAALGFGGITVLEVDSDAGRVRKVGA